MKSLALIRPGALILLGLLPLLFLTLLYSLVDQRRLQLWLSAAVRALFCTALVGALARPVVLDKRQLVATVMLVDVSDSISERQLERARNIVEEARRARKGDEVLELVTFARRPRHVPMPPWSKSGQPVPLERLPGLGDATDLSAALELAYALYPPDTLRRALFVTDGGQTEGNLEAEAERARRNGVRLDYIVLLPEKDEEVLVRSLTLPLVVKPTAPFELLAEVYSSVRQKVTLGLYRDDFLVPMGGKKAVELTPGRNQIRWKTEVVRPGSSTFRVALEGPLRDHFAQNNQASALTLAEGPPRVLYVEGEPQASHYLAGALRREQIDVEVRGPHGLPRSPAELERFDLVLLSDAPSSFVGPEQMAALESYVRDLGGGFIMAGGEQSFGSGGYGGSTIERLLPVRFDSEKRREQPGLGLVLCIDRSGSMAGEKIELAKEAARATAELLGPDDLIGVVAFDSAATPVVRLQRASNRAQILTNIARLQPGGGTSILPALKEAFDELDAVPAKIKHVILLTDGQASYDGIAELAKEMLDRRITVSAVGVGSGADKTLLTMLAERGGGRFYFTKDAENVPQIFTKETNEVARSSLVESPVKVKVQKHVELLDGVGISEAPPLRGYVATKPKPLSEQILVASTGEPILARWRVGLGQAVAFTSDVKNRWAVDWLRWPGYGRLFAQLVRSTMRHEGGRAGQRYALKVDVDPPIAHVTVDAVSKDDRYVSGLETTLEVMDPARPKEKITTTMAQTAAGRYQADVTLSPRGTYLLRAVHRREGQLVAESTGTISLPYPEEYLHLPPNEGLLRRSSEITKGRASPSGRQIFDAGGEWIEYRRDLWPWLVWFALGLLVLDVTLRRIRI